MLIIHENERGGRRDGTKKKKKRTNFGIRRDVTAQRCTEYGIDGGTVENQLSECDYGTMRN